MIIFNNNSMEYVAMTFKVPAGYEQQVTDVVMRKIEGILSTVLLKPTIAKQAEFTAEVAKSYTENTVSKIVVPILK